MTNNLDTLATALQWPGAHLFKPLRQVIASINETFKGRLDLERHRGRTPNGVIACVMQRILALSGFLVSEPGRSSARCL